MQLMATSYARWARIALCSLVSASVFVFSRLHSGVSLPSWVAAFLLPSFAVILYLLWAATRQVSETLDRHCPWSGGITKRGLWQLLWLAGLMLGLVFVPYGLFLLARLLFTQNASTLSFSQSYVFFAAGMAFVFSLLINALHLLTYFMGEWHHSEVQAAQLEQERTHARLEALRSQVNPHFLFNNLNILTSLIELDPVSAKEFVVQFSEVYRYVLKNRTQELVPLQEELTFLESYLFLLRKRFAQGLQAELEIAPESREKLLPPLTLQLLVENAIKHNVTSSKHPLRICLFTSTPDRLTVQNNVQPKSFPASGTGLGLSHIQSQYQYLTGVRVTISPSPSLFTVTLPLLSPPVI